jgi:peroxiredoxin
MRTAQLGPSRIELQGALPLPGERLEADFTIPAARSASRPLVPSDLQEGLVVVSTLPNIEKHACLAQIVELEERSHETIPHLRIVHVSVDHETHWQEVDRFHPNIQAAGYSLCCADPASRRAFIDTFGVGVEGHHRIAHGLFALLDGVFLAADIPADQMKPAEVRTFLQRVATLVRRGTPMVDEPAP